MFKALVVALALITTPIRAAETSSAKPAEEVEVKKAFRMEFHGEGKDASVIIEDKTIRILNSALPPPYDEVVMDNTPENLAGCLWLNDSIKEFSIIVRAVLIDIDREKAAIQRELDEMKKQGNVSPQGPKPTGVPNDNQIK